MTALGWIWSVGSALLLGYFILAWILPTRNVTWLQMGFRLSAAAGLGFGVSSVTYFALGLFTNRTILAVLAMDAALLAGTTTAAVAWRRRYRGPAPTPRAARPEGRMIALLLLAGVVCGGIPLARYWYANPYGGHDAIMIWNLKARFLAQTDPSWRGASSPWLVHGHPDYPLLLPASIGRCWLYSGEQTPVAPVFFAGGFAFSALGLLFFGVSMLRGVASGGMAAAVLLGTPEFLEQIAIQYADIPMAFFVLAALMFVFLAEREPGARGRLLAVAGINAALAAWTKNEGLLFLLVAGLGYFAASAFLDGPKNALRRVVAFLAGALPVVLVVVYFKIVIAPSNDLFEHQSVWTILDRGTNPSRYVQIVAALGNLLCSFSTGFACPLLALAVAAVCFGIRVEPEDRKAVQISSAIMGALVMGYFLIYLITPKPLGWHLMTSLNRVCVQAWPAIVALSFIVIGNPVQTFADRGQLLNTSWIASAQP